MERKAIFEALDEVKRFSIAVTAWNSADAKLEASYLAMKQNGPTSSYAYRGTANVELAAIRRASMDLTRALARMRAPS